MARKKFNAYTDYTGTVRVAVHEALSGAVVVNGRAVPHVEEAGDTAYPYLATGPILVPSSDERREPSGFKGTLTVDVQIDGWSAQKSNAEVAALAKGAKEALVGGLEDALAPELSLVTASFETMQVLRETHADTALRHLVLPLSLLLTPN